MIIVFCLPGREFSGEFFDCWNELLCECIRNNIQVIISRRYSCNIYYVRNMCLGASVNRGKNQKPFDGKIDYDYICWIDSDSIFNFNMLQKLLNHNVDMVGGLQIYEDGTGFTCGNLDEEYFKTNGFMEYYTPESIKKAKINDKGLIDVDYIGFGLVLIKKGVIESMEYPWFRAKWFEINNCKDFSMEDVGFCVGVKKSGYKIYVDPTIKVGHQKKVIL